MFSSVIEGDSLADQLGRVVLASQTHFLFVVDRERTESGVFSLFDRIINVQRARQCWQGYLFGGRWSNPMLDHLLELYELEFSFISEERENIVRQFCTHLAGIGVYGLVHPLEQGWLPRFVAAVNADVRVVWAGQMEFLLRSKDDQAKVNLWQRWLKNHSL